MKHRLTGTRAFLVTALTVVTALCLFSAPSRAVAPRTIGLQGILTDSAGVPKPDGAYTLTFRLYDAAVDGTLLWTELDKTVAVAGGHGSFATILGEPTDFGALVFDIPFFVEVQVAGEDTPMTPRLPLAGVPYALNASSGAATLTLPFSGSISTPDTAITVVNTSGSGIHSITSSGRALWATCSGASYGAFIENTGTGIGANVLAQTGIAVAGNSDSNVGVHGVSNSNIGVYGRGGTSSFGVYADAGIGGSALRGVSVSGRALWATCSGASYGAFIENTGTGIGANVLAQSGIAVAGNSNSNFGVYGASNSSIGVYGESVSYEGVRGVSHNVDHGAVVAVNTTAGAGIYAISQGGGLAGQFDGRVSVQVLEITGGSDLAERFDTGGDAEAGTVMAIDPEHAGALCVSDGAYNRRVAGVISGANKLNAGMILPDTANAAGAQPIAMSGRVWVKCDAGAGAIVPGDMLTTSETPGHAMKVTDYTRSPGATIGKAMSALPSGKGLVLALVSLQ